MDMQMKDSVALVTGASHGLGKAVCLALAAEGVRVGVNYRRDPEKAGVVVKEIKDRFGVSAMVVQGDVGVEAEVVRIYADMERELGPVDVLVNNAALCPKGPIVELTEQVWNQTFQTNMTGAFLCCKHFVKRLQAAKRTGRIVNISSQAAFRGSLSGHMPYDSSKGALISFTISLARELAPQGINVNCVAPGMMVTEMTVEKITKNYNQYIERIPLRRIGTTEDVANVVTFLCSPRSSYMTGATVDVSGGLAMH